MFKLCCLPNICMVSLTPLQSASIILLISKDWGVRQTIPKREVSLNLARKPWFHEKKKKRAIEFIQANAVLLFA